MDLGRLAGAFVTAAKGILEGAQRRLEFRSGDDYPLQLGPRLPTAREDDPDTPDDGSAPPTGGPPANDT